jgi:hypothetical protein
MQEVSAVTDPGLETNVAQSAPSRTCAEVHVLGKWRLIGRYWVAQAVGIFLLASIIVWQIDVVNGPAGRPFGAWDFKNVAAAYQSLSFWGVLLGCIGGLMVLQCVVVWPVRRPRLRGEHGVSLWLSVGVAAVVGTILASVPLIAATCVPDLLGIGLDSDQELAIRNAILAWTGLSYVLGIVLLHHFCVRRSKSGVPHESLLGRVAATLFAGTLVEVAAIMPLDVMARRKTDCYCASQTLWGLMLLIAAGLLTLGPAILLPLLGRRRKRWYAGVCDCCGYDMTALLAVERAIDRCPECGSGWKPEKAGTLSS